jgi:cell division protein FtsB
MQFDPNAVYPVGTVVLIVLHFIAQFGLFARPGQVEQEIARLEVKLAEKYVLKEDLAQRFESMTQQMADIKASITRLHDRIDEMLRNRLSGS